jgi:hypothetical protein
LKATDHSILCAEIKPPGRGKCAAATQRGEQGGDGVKLDLDPVRDLQMQIL